MQSCTGREREGTKSATGGGKTAKAGVGLVLQNPLEGSWTRRPFGDATHRANYTLKIFTPMVITAAGETERAHGGMGSFGDKRR